MSIRRFTRTFAKRACSSLSACWAMISGVASGILMRYCPTRGSMDTALTTRNS